MTLNQDIDALLVSALYGELTPADEARLATHLESHPADRSALDDLKVARQTIRESRIFELQLDPPQAISALLLQEAARRAPKRVVADDTKRETWFGRFVRSFVAHPAMAAAATLVLVVGVAGTLYMRKGNDQFAEQVADQQVAKGEGGAPAREVAQPTTGVAMGDAAAAANEDVTVALRDEENDNKDKAGQGHAGDGKKLGASDAYRKADTTSTVTTDRDRGKQVAHTNVTKPPVSKGVAVVPRQELTPKDLDYARGSKVASPASPDPTAGESRFDGNSNGIVAGNMPGAAGPSGGGTGTTAPRNAAPTPAPPPSAQIATVDKPQVVTKPTDDAKKESGKDDAATAWARDTHQRLLGFVKSGKCQDAAPLAVQIKNKAPDYYNAYVANDRGLKQCMAYINDATERDAEKSQKSRPAKRNEALDSVK